MGYLCNLILHFTKTPFEMICIKHGHMRWSFTSKWALHTLYIFSWTFWSLQYLKVWPERAFAKSLIGTSTVWNFSRKEEWRGPALRYSTFEEFHIVPLPRCYCPYCLRLHFFPLLVFCHLSLGVRTALRSLENCTRSLTGPNPQQQDRHTQNTGAWRMSTNPAPPAKFPPKLPPQTLPLL